MLQSSYEGFIVSSIKMATQLSTKVGLCTHFSVFGYWMKQCVSCLKYYFTLSLPFEQRLVFSLTLRRAKCSLDHYIVFFSDFCFWQIVINGRAKPNLFIAQGESPIQTRQTDLTSHRFSPKLHHHLVTHPVPLRFLLSY